MSTNRQGFGLIEILISVAILSIGLLGLASLQNRSMQSVQEGDNLIGAAMIAGEMAKRMQSNPYILSLGRQGYLALDLTSDIANAGGVLSWATDVETNSPDIARCYAADNTESCYASGATIGNSADHITALNNMLLQDQVEMRRLAWNMLPDGELKLCFDSTNATTTWDCDDVANRLSSRSENVFTVKVRWTNILSNTPQIYVLQFNAECTNGASTHCGNA